MFRVNEPKMFKCDVCRIRYCHENDVYLETRYCEFCYLKMRNNLYAWKERYIHRQIWDTRQAKNGGIGGRLWMYVRDKLELFIVTNLIRDGCEDMLNGKPCESCTKAMKKIRLAGRYNTSFNEEYSQRLLEWRISLLPKELHNIALRLIDEQ